MYRTTIHIRFSSVVYDTPQRSNIERCVDIGIHIVSAVITLKRLVVSVAYVVANRTRPACVCRFNHYQFNTIQSGFVLQKRAELTERPTTKFCSELFVSAFRSKTNVRQIFNSNSFALFFSRLHNVLCDSMVLNSSGSSFFAFKPFQELSTASFTRPCFPLRAFALNRTTNLLSFFSVLIKPFGRMFCAIRSNGDVCQAKVNTQERFNIFHVILHYINRLKQVKLAFLVNQIRFTFDVRNVVKIMANKVNLLSATNTPQRNHVVRFVGHYPTVVSNTAKWFKLPFSFLIQLISICYFGYLPNKHLRRKVKRSLVRMINFVMEFEVIENLLLPRHIRNGIANSISFLHRFEKQVSLFIGRQKFYFQCQLHILYIRTKIQKSFLYQKIILNLFNFKGVSVSLTSHPHFAMNGFHDPLI